MEVLALDLAPTFPSYCTEIVTTRVPLEITFKDGQVFAVNWIPELSCRVQLASWPGLPGKRKKLAVGTLYGLLFATISWPLFTC